MQWEYIPYNDEQAVAWMAQFLQVAASVAAQFGVDPNELTPLANAQADYAKAIQDARDALHAYRAAIRTKQDARRHAVALFRQMAQRMNHHPAMTNELRVQLGLRPRQHGRRRKGVGLEVPGIRLEVDAGRVVIHFGTDPENEQRNSKPEWALGANIYIKAEDEAEYRLLAFDTASPHIWEYRGAPKRFSFRAAYRGRGERDEGAWSDEATVSVGG
ncbi:MAG: hypothetical protein NZM28_06625 [Fimbriimonadales bacterium]|nr:hypothetical protein [Fimbriimonadales bacterium]